MGYYDPMKVTVHHPKKSLEIKGPKRVHVLLRDLGVVPESVLVIRGDELVTEDDNLLDTDVVEIRPVISGGMRERLGEV
jgi:sulfur carrier protein